MRRSSYPKSIAARATITLLMAAFLLWGMLSWLTPITAHAQQASNDFGLQKSVEGTALQDRGEIAPTIANIILAVLTFVGLAFLILMIFGGLRWMTSGGNEQAVSSAKKIIGSATIGLVIVVFGYGIAYFVVESITQASQTGNPMEQR